MPVEVVSASRLLFADLKFIDDVEFWDTLVLPRNTTRADDIIYIVQGGDRIDLLAQRFYQDPVMWWVIAWANDLEILPTDLKEGQQLNIPSKTFVEQELLRQTGRAF